MQDGLYVSMPTLHISDKLLLLARQVLEVVDVATVFHHQLLEIFQEFQSVYEFQKTAKTLLTPVHFNK
jgi:hypothetical protein